MSGDFEWPRETGRVYYRHAAKSALKFDKLNDYLLLLGQRDNECGDISVEVQRRCAGEYEVYWKGVFTIFDATINYDRCWVEAKPDPDDGYNCFEDAIKDDYNIFDAGPIISVTSVSQVAGSYQTQQCYREFTGDEQGPDENPEDLAPPFAGCLDNPGQWCLKSNEFNAQCYEDPNTPQVTICDYRQTTTWHREVATTSCVSGNPVEPDYGTGWQLLSNDCETLGTATWWRCPSSSVDGDLTGPFKNGRLFNDVLKDVTSQLGCGLTVKSNFFGINAVGADPANAAYVYAAANLRHVTLHQKSDVKRKKATNPSTSELWELKAEELFNDLRKWLNVWYIIQDDVLILEHYSYFTSVLGRNLTGAPMTKQISYAGNSNVRSEKFYYSDEGGTGVFRPTTIKYDCGDENRDERLVLFSADLVYISDSQFRENVADENFVLIANNYNDGEYIIIDNNAPLGWANVLPALHPWGRLYRSGSIGDGVPAIFESWLPYVKQEKFNTYFCCGETFDPQNLITTDLGVGVVDSAVHNIYTGKLELELSY